VGLGTALARPLYAFVRVGKRVPARRTRVARLRTHLGRRRTRVTGRRKRLGGWRNAFLRREVCSSRRRESLVEPVAPFVRPRFRYYMAQTPPEHDGEPPSHAAVVQVGLRVHARANAVVVARDLPARTRYARSALTDLRHCACDIASAAVVQIGLLGHAGVAACASVP
jgi:hypothetical protein